ncbi:MAG: 30S ribosomal protein S18 [Nitrospirae bacterium]|nr:30S ribosomal protein S18 [Nitrospirota bacterium]NTW66072.1 30S ribosomal protein S18 [Nitrospirota bacterium]
MAETPERTPSAPGPSSPRPSSPSSSRPSGFRPSGPRSSEGGRPRDSRPGGPHKKRFQVRKKVCRFCVDKAPFIDYKDLKTVKFFITERGKILPRRISGNCARHQREITVAIQRGRNIALLPFSGEKTS